MSSFIQSFKMAIKSISGNRMRAFLTMLGIIIGVMALVILVSLVRGATGTVTDTISSLGTDLVTVTVKNDMGRPIYFSDLAEWEKEDGVGRITTSKTTSATAKYGAENESISLYGVTASYSDVQEMELVLGRYIKSADVDNSSSVCVINETAAEKLLGYTDCLGEEIKLNGYAFTIVGVLEDDEDSLTALLTSGTLIAHIPYSSLIKMSSDVPSEITTFYASAPEGCTMEETDSAITELLMQRFDDEDAFEVSSQNIMEDAMSDITGVLTILLGGIAAISLIVGGVGIMNIMLVTVTERTREIGIRKAIGASRGVILQQFLIESVVLCMFGCLIGIGCSWGILRAISVVVSSLDITFKMDASVVLIAVLFCFAIGICFGLYPANKAAKMKPIDALHYGG